MSQSTTNFIRPLFIFPIRYLWSKWKKFRKTNFSKGYQLIVNVSFFQLNIYYIFLSI